MGIGAIISAQVKFTHHVAFSVWLSHDTDVLCLVYRSFKLRVDLAVRGELSALHLIAYSIGL